MNRSIRTKMIVTILPLVMVVFVAAIVLASRMSAASEQQLAYTQMQETARHYASQFDTQLRAHQAAVQTLGRTMEATTTEDRSEVENILHQVLINDPTILATYVGYEPNAYDSQDAKWVNKPGHDATGRFVPYWNRLTGTVELDPLVDYDTSDYYLLPKKTQAFQVIEPYLYQGVLMASYIAPIMRNGKFVGIAGEDVSLTALNDAVSKIKAFDTGYAFLVSHSGIFVAYGNKDFIGTKTLTDYSAQVNNPALADIAKSVANGQEGHVTTTDPLTGKNVAMFYAPVSTGDWGLVMVVPTSEMLADSTCLTTTLVGVGVVGLLIIAVLIVFMATLLARPIVTLRGAVERIACGDLDVQLSVSSRDEIGQISSAFGKMLSYLRDMAGTARRVAGGNLSESPVPLSERDQLGTAFAAMVANLRRLVAQIADGAAQVASASEQLASAAEQSGEATGQVTGTIQQVAQGTASQASSTTEVTAAMDEIARRVRDIAAGAEAQAGLVQGAGQKVGRLQETLKDAGRGMEVTAATAQQVAGAARESATTVERTVQGMEAINQSTAQVAAPCARWASAPRRSARSSARSRTSPTRPTCWRSMPPSRRPGPASRAAALRWWPTRCASWPRRPGHPRARSPTWCGPCRRAPKKPCGPPTRGRPTWRGAWKGRAGRVRH